MQINQSIAVVTGAASGLGQATVQMLLDGGARVAAIDLAAPALSHERALALAADVSDAAAMESAFARVAAVLGVPGILVNCAGVLGPARVFRIDKATGKPVPRELDAFRRVIDINLVGTFNAVRLFAQGLAANALDNALDNATTAADRGVIVNTASVAAFEALSGQAAYGSSKAAVASMTLPLARELARLGIRVMAVAPGTFETGMYTDIPEHTRRALVADVPFPPRAGRPDEFAHMVRALIENQMMNGSVVRIDGAVRMREPVRSAS
ncbi:MAG: SDR family NAD(P)-dependent oxidoreductase [Comamonadaceae bacterium]|nr:MAG: SDR family NAD(P)-dependent oxidoreductase [Comamonadaceae bacterium]